MINKPERPGMTLNSVAMEAAPSSVGQLMGMLRIFREMNAPLKEIVGTDQYPIVEAMRQFFSRRSLVGLVRLGEIAYTTLVMPGNLLGAWSKDSSGGIMLPGSAIYSIDPPREKQVTVVHDLEGEGLVEALEILKRTGKADLLTLQAIASGTKRQVFMVEQPHDIVFVIDTWTDYEGEGDDILKRIVELGRPTKGKDNFLWVEERTAAGMVLRIPRKIWKEKELEMSGTAPVDTPPVRYSGPLGIPGISIAAGFRPSEETVFGSEMIRKMFYFMKGECAVYSRIIEAYKDGTMFSPDIALEQFRSDLMEMARHDLKNVLSNVKGWLHKIIDGMLENVKNWFGSQNRELKDVFDGWFKQITDLFVQTEQFAKIDLSLRQIEVVPELTEAIERSRKEYEGRFDSLIVKGKNDNVNQITVYAIPYLQQYMIDNILSNVYKIAEAGNTKLNVDMVYRDLPEYLEVEIENDGPHMDQVVEANINDHKKREVESNVKGSGRGIKVAMRLMRFIFGEKGYEIKNTEKGVSTTLRFRKVLKANGNKQPAETLSLVPQVS